jgi:hypothetical protein
MRQTSLESAAPSPMIASRDHDIALQSGQSASSAANVISSLRKNSVNFPIFHLNFGAPISNPVPQISPPFFF